MPRRKPTTLTHLDALVADITVDAHNDDEPQTVFLEVFDQEVRLPAAATLLGMPPPRWVSGSSTPCRPEGKGKIERYFEIVRGQSRSRSATARQLDK